MDQCSEPSCGEAPWGTSQYCILHDPSPHKDAALFQAELEARIEQQEADPSAQPIDLRGVVFPQPVDWAGRKFAEGVDLRGATFSGEADFDRATFSGGADFRGATFSGRASFGAATFSGRAYFHQATFSGRTDFSWATFSPWAAFWEATFSGEADFGGATFRGGANFYRATFNESAHFSEARFAGRLRFTRTGFQGRPLGLDFRNVGLERPEEAAFEHVSLAAASLVGTDMSRVRLVGVEWREGGQAGGETTGWRRPWWWLVPRQRLLLYDHRQLLEGRGTAEPDKRPERGDYDRVELLYRQLRINLEASKQEVEAGEFYIGEMEMRRLNPAGSLWGPRALLELYRWAAHYGESYWRPFLFYLALGLLFALGYLFLGVQALGAPVHYQAFVAGDVTPFARDLLVVWVRGSLTTGLPLGQDFRPAGAASALLQLTNLVANAVLIALTVIAVRRHFKR